MSTKTLVFLGMTIGSVVGGYLATLLGAGVFSYSSVLLSSAGAIAGIFIGYKLSNF